MVVGTLVATIGLCTFVIDDPSHITHSLNRKYYQSLQAMTALLIRWDLCSSMAAAYLARRCAVGSP
jgi:hypothetical protein